LHRILLDQGDLMYHSVSPHRVIGNHRGPPAPSLARIPMPKPDRNAVEVRARGCYTECSSFKEVWLTMWRDRDFTSKRRSSMTAPRVLFFLAGLVASAAADPYPKGDFHAIVISDTHFRNEPRAAQALASIVARANALPGVELVLVTGDLVSRVYNDCTKENPDTSKCLLADAVKILRGLKMPFYLAMGNHDYRIGPKVDSDASFSAARIARMEEIWTATTGFAPYYAATHRGWKFIVLNSFRGQPEKRHFDRAQLAWFEKQLADGAPAVVLFHYPFLTDRVLTIWAGWRHLITARSDRAFYNILKAHKNHIAAIFVGHGHMWAADRFARTIPVYETASLGAPPVGDGKDNYLFVSFDTTGNAVAVRRGPIAPPAPAPSVIAAASILATAAEPPAPPAAAAGRAESVTRFAADFARLGRGDGTMLVGVASSMEKVLPRDMPFTLAATNTISVSLARNEKESVQVAVLPPARALSKVAVTASDLRSANGGVFPAGCIACDVVGYVETKKRPPYDVPFVGWWPDPILDFLGPVDVAAGDLQTFWIRVRAAKDQAPGSYRGTLTVSAAETTPFVFDLNVTVRAFAIPDRPPLPTAITFDPPEFSEYIRTTICGGPEGWQKLKFVWADFLADYRMDFDSLYRHGPPDFEVLKYRHDKGTLTDFNFGYIGANPDENVARFRPTYEKAKELDILDHAYMYGFDECPAEQFPALEAAARALKQAFPEVPVMTTSYDTSYGLASVAKSVDGWCPLTAAYNVEQAAKARAAGRMVWWYICC
jgi:hypothetical protein